MSISLLSYVKSQAAAATSAKAVKIRQCLDTLAEHLASEGKNQAPLTDLLNEVFLRKLIDTLKENGRLETFTTLYRQAIAEGYLPPIYLLPQITGEKGYAPKPFDYEAEIKRLCTAVAADLTDRHKAPEAWPALVYIAGIFAYGAEPQQLLALAEPEAPEQSVIFTPEPLGVEAEMPTMAREIIDLANGSKKADGRLLRRLHEPENFDAQLQKYLRRHSIGLYKSRSVFLDWLGLALAKGLDPALATNLATASSGNLDEVSSRQLIAMGRILANDHCLLVPRWRILRSYSPSLRSDALKKQLERYIADAGIPFNPRRQLYDPQYSRKVLVRGKIQRRNSPIVSRFLFVRSDTTLARRIDRFHPDASLMRRLGDTSQYAVVSRDEILRLITLLRDFRDDIEIIDSATWAGAAGNALEPGDRVRILSGPMRGLTGTIWKAKAKAPQPPKGGAITQGLKSKSQGLKSKDQSPATAAAAFAETRRYKVLVDFASQADIKVLADLPAIDLTPLPSEDQTKCH